MRKELRLAFALALLAGLLLQCAPVTGPEDEPPPTAAVPTPTLAEARETFTTPALAATLPPPTDISEEEMTNLPPASTPFRGADQLIDLARQDLAQRLAIDPTGIELERAEVVVWPDGSLGCPQPGMVYTQVQRDGYRILLRVDKEIYPYHGGGSRGPFLCEQMSGDELLPPPGLGDD